MSINLRLGIGINKRRGGGLSIPLSKFLFLWTGKVDGSGNLLSDLNTDIITVNSKDFATEYIPSTSTSTFNIPNTTDYQNADTDNFWYDAGLINVTIAQMAATDNDRTFIKYANTSPYNVSWIGILKVGETLTQSDKNSLSWFFDLWLYYFGVLNDYGVLKENRESSSYSTEYQTVYDAMSNPPSSSVADLQDQMMIDLNTAGILAKLDVLQIYADENNNLLNWINPGTFDPILGGAPNPAFTSLEGWVSDGANGYIDSGYDPNDGAQYSQDSACMFAYIRNNVGEAGRDFGVNTGASLIELLSRHTDDKAYAWVNSATASSIANTDSRGMYILNRTLSTHQDLYKNKVRIINAAVNSIALEDYNHNAYVLGLNNLGSLNSPSTRQVSVFGAGSGLTQQNIDDLTDIIEAYMDANGKGVIT